MLKKAKDKLKNSIKEHVSKNLKVYIILLVCFIIGIVLGSLAMVSLSPNKKNELADYLVGFLQLYDKQNISGADIFFASLWDNIKVVSLIWILGLAVIGEPFICFVIMVRGFITAFTASFMIWSAGQKGLIFLLVGLLPNELMMTSLLLFLSTNGIVFSMSILKGKSLEVQEKLSHKILKYCMSTIILFAIMTALSAILSWIMPLALRVIL